VGPVSALGERHDVKVADVRSRTPNAASAMPPGAVKRRQIRDMIEFLSRQEKGRER